MKPALPSHQSMPNVQLPRTACSCAQGFSQNGFDLDSRIRHS